MDSKKSRSLLSYKSISCALPQIPTHVLYRLSTQEKFSIQNSQKLEQIPPMMLICILGQKSICDLPYYYGLYFMDCIQGLRHLSASVRTAATSLLASVIETGYAELSLDEQHVLHSLLVTRLAKDKVSSVRCSAAIALSKLAQRKEDFHQAGDFSMHLILQMRF